MICILIGKENRRKKNKRKFTKITDFFFLIYKSNYDSQKKKNTRNTFHIYIRKQNLTYFNTQTKRYQTQTKLRTIACTSSTSTYLSTLTVIKMLC